jgi:hypothetical protein
VLHIEIQSTPGGSYTALDLTALRICQIKLQIGYSHPATLTWAMYQPQQSIPIAINTFLRFWDDAYGTAADPQFEGFVAECSPGSDANMVTYTAYDQTAKASQEITVMSTAWVNDGGTIVEGIGAIPRLVFNNKIDNDDDFAFERTGSHDLSTGNMLATILSDALLPLRYFNAAPAASDPYVAADLDSFVFRPQEKMVFETQSIRSALEQLLQWEPAVKMIFVPGTANRKWRFQNVYDAPQVTFTLNDYSGTYKVLSLDLRRSLEGRYTAVKIYGPPTSTIQTFSTLDGTLAAIGAGTVLETYTDTSGEHQVIAHTQYQIVDPNKRRGTRLLPEAVYAEMGAWQWTQTRAPYLQFSFDGGNTWATLLGTNFNFSTGTADIGTYLYYWSDHELVYGSTQHFFVPNAVRVIYAPYSDPLSVRSPTSGFSGTAYTVANVQTELRIYDEMLAIGYERGIPFSTPARLAQFQQLADIMQAQRRDIVYAGGCTLDGLQYEFQRLNRAVNLAAVDGDGNAITTGWESVGALVTDVEYDYEEPLPIPTMRTQQKNPEKQGFFRAMAGTLENRGRRRLQTSAAEIGLGARAVLLSRGAPGLARPEQKAESQCTIPLRSSGCAPQKRRPLKRCNSSDVRCCGSVVKIPPAIPTSTSPTWRRRLTTPRTAPTC